MGMKLGNRRSNGHFVKVNGRGIARRGYRERVELAAGARTGKVAITNLSARQAPAVFGVSPADVSRAIRTRATNGNGNGHGHGDTVQKRLAEIVAEIGGVDQVLSALAASEERKTAA
jgi:hypothetical protein